MSQTLNGLVHVRVNEDIKLEQVQSLVAQIVGMSGCRTCGLMGIDLRLSGDPVEAKQIAGLPGVKSVTIGH